MKAWSTRIPGLRGASLSGALLLACAAPVACGGEGSECRSSADCSASLECAGPSEPQVCGIPANEQCSSDADCGEGSRCHAVDDPCSPDGVGAECRPPCEPGAAGACVAGFRCGEGGACEVVPCDEAPDPCPSHQTCDPTIAQSGPVFARASGCVAIACADDGGCPADTACVNGVCQAGPGSCTEPQAVP